MSETEYSLFGPFRNIFLFCQNRFAKNRSHNKMKATRSRFYFLSFPSFGDTISALSRFDVDFFLSCRHFDSISNIFRMETTNPFTSVNKSNAWKIARRYNKNISRSFNPFELVFFYGPVFYSIFVRSRFALVFCRFVRGFLSSLALFHSLWFIHIRRFFFCLVRASDRTSVDGECSIFSKHICDVLMVGDAEAQKYDTREQQIIVTHRKCRYS